MAYHYVKTCLQYNHSHFNQSYFQLSSQKRKFPGSPVVKTWYFHHWGPDLTPSWGTKIPQAAWYSQEKKKKLKRMFQNSVMPIMLMALIKASMLKEA